VHETCDTMMAVFAARRARQAGEIRGSSPTCAAVMSDVGEGRWVRLFDVARALALHLLLSCGRRLDGGIRPAIDGSAANSDNSTRD
jgi:hypothetical protein